MSKRIYLRGLTIALCAVSLGCGSGLDKGSTLSSTSPGGGSGGGGSGGGSGSTAGCHVHASDFGGGVGTAADPFILSTVAHWNAIGKEESKMPCHYKLDGDIDFGATTPTPIGGTRSAEVFKGVLDGDNHKIANGTLPKTDSGGFVVHAMIVTTSGTIKNLSVENFSLVAPAETGDHTIGGVVGQAYGTAVLTNLRSHNLQVTTGTSSSGAFVFGGIVGVRSSSAAVTDSELHVAGLTLNAGRDGNMGAVVGKVEGSQVTLRRCSSYNADMRILVPQGGSSIGGVMGATWGEPVIEDCLVQWLVIHVGDINDNSGSGQVTCNLGGIAGAGSGIIRRSGANGVGIYTSMQVGSGCMIGGIAGTLAGSGSIQDVHGTAVLSAAHAESYVGSLAGRITSTATPTYVRTYTDTTVNNLSSGFGNNHHTYVGNEDTHLQTGSENSFKTQSGGTYDGVTTTAYVDMGAQTNFPGWDFSSGGIWSENIGGLILLRGVIDLYDAGIMPMSKGNK